MKKMVLLVVISGAISLTACGNNVELENETQKSEFIEETETEKIEIEELDIETVKSSDDDFDDEYETDEDGDFMYEYEDFMDVRQYLPKVAQKYTFDRFDIATVSNEEFDKFAKENLLDCGTVVVTDGEYCEGYRVFVDKRESGPAKAETYFVRDNHGLWNGSVDICVLWSYDWISVRGYDNIHTICEED